MAKYLLIESRGPEGADFCYDLATGLAGAGHDVTLFLVQNGVLPARTGSANGGLSRMSAAGVRVLADDFSLRERGISASKLANDVTAAPIDTVVDALAEGRKAIWH